MLPNQLPTTSIQRPKWIPDHITENWDTDPYAYQTKEDLMPHGGPHGRTRIEALIQLSGPLRRHGLLVLTDIFLIYEDRDEGPNRCAPDLLVVPCQPGDSFPYAYDIRTDPMPICAIEIVSEFSKEDDKVAPQFYIDQLGIPNCITIDRVDDEGNVADEATVSVWRHSTTIGHATQVKSNCQGQILVPDIFMLACVEGNKVDFFDIFTEELWFDVEIVRTMHHVAERRKCEALQAQITLERYKRETAEERTKAAQAQVEMKQQQIEALQAQLQALLKQ